LMHISYKCWSTRMPGELRVKVRIHLVKVDTVTKSAPPCMPQRSWQAKQAIIRKPPGLKTKIHTSLSPRYLEPSILHSSNNAQQQSPNVNLRAWPTNSSSSLPAGNLPQTLDVHWLPCICYLCLLSSLRSSHPFLYWVRKSLVRRPHLLVRSTLQPWSLHLLRSLRISS
jgi:hypothetical protein